MNDPATRHHDTVTIYPHFVSAGGPRARTPEGVIFIYDTNNDVLAQITRPRPVRLHVPPGDTITVRAYCHGFPGCEQYTAEHTLLVTGNEDDETTIEVGPGITTTPTKRGTRPVGYQFAAHFEGTQPTP